MRIYLFLLAALVSLAVISGPAFAEKDTTEQDGVYGLWLVGSKRAAVEITPCKKSLCGQVVWIIEGGLTRDKNHPNKAKRDRAICGLKILRGFERDEPGKWSDGEIYDAKEGKTYKASIRVKDNDRLFLRGYVGIPLFGKTQEWTRLPEDHARCTPPDATDAGDE